MIFSVQSMRSKRRLSLADRLFIIVLLIGAAFLLILSLLQHRALGTGYDLGIYDQTVWNLSHGRIWQTTLVYETNGYYDHFEPILALLVPLYWFWPDVRVLLIVQAVALALGALPIYLFARYQFRVWAIGSWAALAVVVVYLAFPAMHHANLNDFHEVSLLPPLLGFALYGLLTGKQRVTWIFLALSLAVKEDFGVTFLAFGLYILVFKPEGFKRRNGLLVMLAAVIWVVLVLYVLYPLATRGMPYPFVARRYPWMGDSPQSAVKILLTQPWIVLPYLIQPQKLQFLLRLFAPLLFLPLLGMPVVLLAFPMFIYLMLSNYEAQWSVQSYYNPPLLPILFMAFVLALQWLRRTLLKLRWPARRAEITLATLVVITIAISYYLDAPGPGSKNFTRVRFQVNARAEAAYRIMAQVPDTASLSTIWWLVPHLSQRERVYTVLARPTLPVDYILTEDLPGAPTVPLYPAALPDYSPLVYHRYTPVAEDTPFRLLQYSNTMPLTVLSEEPLSYPLSLAGYLWLDTDGSPDHPTIQAGGTARLVLAWHKTVPLDRRYGLFVHLLSDGSSAATNGSPDALVNVTHEPNNGQFPTTLWDTWTRPSMVLDENRLEIPTDIPPGIYYAWAGVYDVETGQRIELGGPGQTLKLVGPLEVVKKNE